MLISTDLTLENKQISNSNNLFRDNIIQVDEDEERNKVSIEDSPLQSFR